jgi:hypothetical protein
MILTKALACLAQHLATHQYARQAAIYRMNKVKRFVWPIHATTSGAKNPQNCDVADPRLGARIALA